MSHRVGVLPQGLPQTSKLKDRVLGRLLGRMLQQVDDLLGDRSVLLLRQPLECLVERVREALDAESRHGIPPERLHYVEVVVFFNPGAFQSYKSRANYVAILRLSDNS